MNKDRANNMTQSQSFTAWFSGTLNRYQIIATSRKEALELFAKMHGVIVSSYMQCRKSKGGDHMLLQCGSYGVFQ